MTARARNNDPSPSHAAAHEIEHNGSADRQRDRVLRALCQHAPCGLTSAELAEAAGLDRYMVARRLPELQDRGDAWVRPVGETPRPEKRTCTVKHRTATVWRPVATLVRGVVG